MCLLRCVLVWMPPPLPHSRYGKVKYPEFKDNVATVYSHPLSMGSNSYNHYGGNAETYMNIGQAMGEAMVALKKLKAE